MISIAPLAAEPCWQVITPMMFGQTSQASLRFKVPTLLKERSTNRQELQTPTFVGIGQVRTALSSMQPGQARFLASQVECNLRP